MKIFFLFSFFIFVSSFGRNLTQEELDLIGGSNIGFKPGVCDPRQLEDIEHLDYYYTQKVPANEQIMLTCKRPYGYVNKDRNGRQIVESSFYVMCNSDGTFSGAQQCLKTCDVSDVLQTKFNYDLPKTKNITTGGSVSGTKLVLENDTIEIFCFTGYMVKDLSIQTNVVSSYKYTCGSLDPNQRKILECVKQPLTFSTRPPKSSFAEGEKIPQKCRAGSLLIPNTVITGGSAAQGGTIPEYIDIGKTIEFSCDIKNKYTTTAGLATPSELGYKIAKKFAVTCDPDGSGKFIGIQGCAQRCNVSELIKRSDARFVQNSVIVNQSNNSIGNVANKNVDEPWFADIGSRVKINCTKGYQIRKLLTSNYISECLPGGVFSNIEVCEEEIKPCNNSEIDFGGTLNGSGAHLTNDTIFDPKGTTQVGSSLALECKGGNDYFIPKNDKPKQPRCEYDSRTNQGKWSHTTFECYDGCIFNDFTSASRKLNRGEASTFYEDKLEKVFTKEWVSNLTIGSGISATKVTPGLKIDSLQSLHRIFNNVNLYEFLPIPYVSSVSQGTFLSSNGNQEVKSLALLFERKAYIYYCENKQEIPLKFKFEYQFIKATNASLQKTNAGVEKRSSLAFFDGGTACSQSSSGGCLSDLAKKYNAREGYYSNNYKKLADLVIDSKNLQPEAVGGIAKECNKIFDSIITSREPTHDCHGTFQSSNKGGTCDITYNPALLEAARCTIFENKTGGILSRTRSHTKYKHTSGPSYTSNTNDANPSVQKMTF